MATELSDPARLRKLAGDLRLLKGDNNTFSAAFDAAATEIDQYQISFDLRWNAAQRATERWQAAHPGNDRVWPDASRLDEWLMNQVELLHSTLEKYVAHVEAWETETYITERHRQQASPGRFTDEEWKLLEAARDKTEDPNG